MLVAVEFSCLIEGGCAWTYGCMGMYAVPLFRSAQEHHFGQTTATSDWGQQLVVRASSPASMQHGVRGASSFAKSLWGVRPFLVSTDVGSVEFTGRQAYMRLWFSLQSRVDGWRFYSPSGTAVPMSAWWLVEWKDLAWVQDCGGSAFFV